jgi:anti-anti-sigma factor
MLELRQRYDPDGALRVTLVGELDVAERVRVRFRLRQLAHAHGRVRLDLSQLGFIDCSGVHAILGALAEASGAGRELEVDPRVSPSVEQIAALLGVAASLWPAEATPSAPATTVGGGRWAARETSSCGC